MLISTHCSRQETRPDLTTSDARRPVRRPSRDSALFEADKDACQFFKSKNGPDYGIGAARVTQ
jgi:hypothetical protein